MPTLYIVATPIGNLEDITLRALKVLKEVDVVIAEDTRRTRKLLAHYQITKTILPLHERSSSRDQGKVVSLLGDSTLACVVDSGTPGISDPGASFIAAVLKAYGKNARIVPIPGPSALTALTSIVGQPMRRFLFFGFLPKKKGRNKALGEIAASLYPVIIFESPHRIIKTLLELQRFGKFSLVVGRELTKTFETVYQGAPEEVLEDLGKGTIKGEFTVCIMKNEVRARTKNHTGNS